MPIDYKKYPSNWTSEIVPRILKRAKNCCEKCGVKNKEQLHSIRIRIQDHISSPDGRYKFKTFWITDESDFIRIKDYAYPDEKRITVVLTIAHLDHDETNHKVKDDRLQAMCQMCHLRYDSREKYRRICSKATQNKSSEEMIKETDIELGVFCDRCWVRPCICE